MEVVVTRTIGQTMRRSARDVQRLSHVQNRRGVRDLCTIPSTPVCVGVERGRGIVWLEPSVTVEVQYNELMQGRLRDAVLRGIPKEYEQRPRRHRGW